MKRYPDITNPTVVPVNYECWAIFAVDEPEKYHGLKVRYWVVESKGKVIGDCPESDDTHFPCVQGLVWDAVAGLTHADESTNFLGYAESSDRKEWNDIFAHDWERQTPTRLRPRKDSGTLH